jgi:hypothetical protein
LVVPRRRQAQLNRRTSIETLNWKQIADVEIAAVRCDQIDFRCAIVGLDVPVRTTPRRAAADDDDAPISARPLALHTGKTIAQVEHEVVSQRRNWSRHTDTELDCGGGDPRLCNCSLLVGRQLHVLSMENGPDGPSSVQSTPVQREGVRLKSDTRNRPASGVRLQSDT